MIESDRIYYINRSKDFLYLLLKNLNGYAIYHPLIKEVKFKENSVDGKNIFLIKEQPYPEFPILIKYSAIVSEPLGKIRFDILGIPFHQATIEYKLIEKDKTNTEIYFTIIVKGPPISKRILINKMVKAQDQLMQNLNSSDR